MALCRLVPLLATCVAVDLPWTSTALLRLALGLLAFGLLGLKLAVRLCEEPK